MKALVLLTIIASAVARYNIVHYKNTLPQEPQFVFPALKTSKAANSHLTAQDLTDNQIIQQVFEGLFAQNNLVGPFMIKYCFDDQISHEVVVYITDALARASRASLTDLLKLVNQTVSFYKNLPWPFIECLGRCQQIQSLGHKYDIDGSIDVQALGIKVSQYMVLHFLQAHRWAVDLNDKWGAKRYHDAGYNVGVYGHIIQNSRK